MEKAWDGNKPILPDDNLESLMLKNILATIGLAVVTKAAYEHYCEYRELKREREEREGRPA